MIPRLLDDEENVKKLRALLDKDVII